MTMASGDAGIAAAQVADVGAGAIRPARSQQLTTFFRNPEFLRYVGGTLKTTNVLDYFATSDFFERASNNAILAMQGGGAAGVAANNAAAAATAAGEPPREVARAWEEKRNDPFILEQELCRFIGLECVLAHAKPPDLFVVHKRWRSSPTETSVLEAYYVLHGNVHMAGDLFNVLASRMLSATSALGASLSLARNAQPDFNAREGFSWRIAAEHEPDDEDVNDGIEDDETLKGVTSPGSDSGDATMVKKQDAEQPTQLPGAGKAEKAIDESTLQPPPSIVKTRRQSREAVTGTSPKRRRSSRAS